MNSTDVDAVPKKILTPSPTFRLYQRLWQVTGILFALFGCVFVGFWFIMATMLDDLSGTVVFIATGVINLLLFLYLSFSAIARQLEIGFDNQRIYYRHFRTWRSIAFSDIEAIRSARVPFFEFGSYLYSSKLSRLYWLPDNGIRRRGRALFIPTNIISHHALSQLIQGTKECCGQSSEPAKSRTSGP